jgi:hypothetical protein
MSAAPNNFREGECFTMPAVGAGSLGPEFPAGAVGIWEAGPVGRPGKPVLLEDHAGEFHVRLYEPRGASDWAGVAFDPTLPTMTPGADGVRIVARLRCLDMDATLAAVNALGRQSA